jgi:hypothetical protein
MKNETREEEEKRRIDAEGGGTYAHGTTTMRRIFFSFSRYEIFLTKRKKECQTTAEASDFISDFFLSS